MERVLYRRLHFLDTIVLDEAEIYVWEEGLVGASVRARQHISLRCCCVFFFFGLDLFGGFLDVTVFGDIFSEKLILLDKIPQAYLVLEESLELLDHLALDFALTFDVGDYWTAEYIVVG